MAIPKNGSITRRGFLRGTLAAGAVVALPQYIPSTALGKDGAVAPSEKITVGFIGTGSHGVGMNLQSFLRLRDSQAVALCDVDEPRMISANNLVKRMYGKGFKGCFTTGDWREIIARDDIDAVMISTPDHWHVPMSLAAIRAGKDVECEKPTMTIEEGRILSDTVKRYGTVYQTSTEDRSIGVYHRMAELVRNGRIGKLHTIRVTLPGGPGNKGHAAPQPVPKGFNYDMWLGPAPWAPYTKDRCHYHFRWIRDYSGGQLADWGAHLFDTVQWATDTERTGPVEIEGHGVSHVDGLYDTAHTYHIEYLYADGVRMIVDSGGVNLRFEGSEGWVGNRGWRGPLKASSPRIAGSIIRPEEIHLFKGNGEQRNFLDCVRTRKDPYFPAEIGHRCCSLAHLGNIAMDLGRKIRWNPDKEEFIDDAQANRLRSRSMRAPWTL
ncbi:MAG: Gfo/Idh/MocA family oxidoreductase [Phycisphaerae bacterium]|jgi:predicted dehydrogenase|nr:Gfo/Idh/MocA family oxidoreductase [Phycisphaerae bacterium]